MNDKVKVLLYGEEMEVEVGTTLLELSRKYQDKEENDIILALVDRKLRELTKEITKPCEIKFLTTRDDAGRKTYVRGITLVLIKAVYNVIGSDNIDKFLVQFSLGNGFYCKLESKVVLTNEILEKISKKMESIIKADMPFEKRTVGTDEAMELFRKNRMYDKEKLFKYRRVSKANIYSLGGFEDYFYGYMPASTGMLKYFKLHLYDEGLILQVPSAKTPTVIDDYKPLDKLYNTLKESSEWGVAMNVDTVGALNDVISSGGINDLILVQEAFQEKKIAEIAEQIKEAGNKKFVMIAGPSSSGKTTFSHRLSIQLMTHGLKPHPIAVDNYFVDREHTPLDEDGNPNFECLGAIDVEKFNQDMTALLNGERVELPEFNFKTGKREYKGNYKQLGEDDILVIEGIHCLNDKLSYSLPQESKFKIYISALAQINVDEHNRIQTTDGRLIRRMVRDNRTRGTKAGATIAMWPSVRKGENENIFPFQEEADVMFNSALIYELAVLKQYAEPVLFGIDRDSDEYMEAKRLLKFLDYFIGVSSEEIPKNSILREFVGGSCFKVG
ncbi:MAG: nucleoside kinase [Lachnospiraceae bacterium]|nr:nucleoside kinase [Lachnospiraceae bacterium]